MVSVRQRSADFFVRYAIVEADRQCVRGPKVFFSTDLTSGVICVLKIAGAKIEHLSIFFYSSLKRVIDGNAIIYQ